MNNQQRINDFLTYWAKIGIQNPDYSFDTELSKDQIYHELIHIGVPEREKEILLSKPFPESVVENSFQTWINYYQDNDKIFVFNPSYWSYFCQFISKDAKARNLKEHIKMYVPLDSAHIQKGAELIFDFLTENNISHISKIGKMIRFDDIVIRLADENDAKKLLEFIKGNYYLQEGLLEANPFAFQQDRIAMVCDGQESYNGTIASIISMYLNDLKRENKLTKASYQDFYHYLSERYKNEFIEMKEQNLEKIFEIKNREERLNYQYIIALLLRCQDPNFTLNNYFEHFRNSLNSKTNNVQKEEENVKELLQELINTMNKKLGKEKADLGIKMYLQTGNPVYITRVNNLRERVQKTSLVVKLSKILRDQRINFGEYVEKYIQTEEEDYEELFLLAIEEMNKRLGNIKGPLGVKKYLETGNSAYLTRNNNLRERIVNSNMREKILRILALSNQTFEEYLKEVQEEQTVSKRK